MTIYSRGDIMACQAEEAQRRTHLTLSTKRQFKIKFFEDNKEDPALSKDSKGQESLDKCVVFIPQKGGEDQRIWILGICWDNRQTGLNSGFKRNQGRSGHLIALTRQIRHSARPVGLVQKVDPALFRESGGVNGPLKGILSPDFAKASPGRPEETLERTSAGHKI